MPFVTPLPLVTHRSAGRPLPESLLLIGVTAPRQRRDLYISLAIHASRCPRICWSSSVPAVPPTCWSIAAGAALPPCCSWYRRGPLLYVRLSLLCYECE
ncbi:hypothetical protein Syun_030718 [Stephania yunnanensis]|uniref:Uncharacterized protein n=1 Tax=Stephania yunnanensis TaxID=152371 RepID=A0AAP0DVN4_9MAGN